MRCINASRKEPGYPSRHVITCIVKCGYENRLSASPARGCTKINQNLICAFLRRKCNAMHVIASLDTHCRVRSEIRGRFTIQRRKSNVLSKTCFEYNSGILNFQTATYPFLDRITEKSRLLILFYGKSKIQHGMLNGISKHEFRPKFRLDSSNRQRKLFSIFSRLMLTFP